VLGASADCFAERAVRAQVSGREMNTGSACGRKRGPEGTAAKRRTERAVRAHVSAPERSNDGAEDWNRTSDTSIFSAVLYRLSYLGTPWRRSAEPSS
jgi:hypothetical protein